MCEHRSAASNWVPLASARELTILFSISTHGRPQSVSRISLARLTTSSGASDTAAPAQPRTKAVTKRRLRICCMPLKPANQSDKNRDELDPADLNRGYQSVVAPNVFGPTVRACWIFADPSRFPGIVRITLLHSPALCKFTAPLVAKQPSIWVAQAPGASLRPCVPMCGADGTTCVKSSKAVPDTEANALKESASVCKSCKRFCARSRNCRSSP